MAEVALTKRKVEPGETERLREWMAGVEDREGEAIETLRDEGVYTEATFLERTDEGHFLVLFVEAEDLEASFEAFLESDHEIDRELRELMAEKSESREPVSEHELLYSLTTPERP